MLSRKSGLKEDPMSSLEFVKAGFNFETMKQQSPEYATEKFFPQEVEIVDGQYDGSDQIK